MDQETKNRLADRSIWVRALYMIILVIAYSIGETLLVIISVFQFLSALITGKVNESLHSFGANLSAYLYVLSQMPSQTLRATTTRRSPAAPEQPLAFLESLIGLTPDQVYFRVPSSRSATGNSSFSLQ